MMPWYTAFCHQQCSRPVRHQGVHLWLNRPHQRDRERKEYPRTPMLLATEERTWSKFKEMPSISEEATISCVKASRVACFWTSNPKADNLPSRKPAALFTFASLRLMRVWSHVKFGQFSVWWMYISPSFFCKYNHLRNINRKFCGLITASGAVINVSKHKERVKQVIVAGALVRYFEGHWEDLVFKSGQR